jgi:hypothetical protein
VIFLVLAGGYAALRWRQERQSAREEQARKLFQLTPTDISGLSLVRGSEEVRLAKKNRDWYLTTPLSTKADQTIVDNLVTTLARLRRERDLGVQKNLVPFGLDKPPLVVKFTARGQMHQLAVGAPVPGGDSYYVLKDQDPHLLTITVGSKDSLDRRLLALRDKTLLSFISDEVKGLRIRTGKTTVNLEKTAPRTWRWVGRPDFKVRGDRVEKILRDLHIARAQNFLEPPPGNLKALGLDPRHRTEITVVTPAGDQTLALGAQKGDTVYARLGPAGPVVQVDAALSAEIPKTLASLQDRRLWSGAISQVARIVWGPPGHTWTAVKDGETWKLTGPQGAATQQPAARLEMALWNFQKLEAGKTLPSSRAASGPPSFILELFAAARRPLLHLEAMEAAPRGQLQVLTREGDKTVTALIDPAPFRQWQAEMQRLTVVAPKPGDSQKKGGSPKS